MPLVNDEALDTLEARQAFQTPEGKAVLDIANEQRWTKSQAVNGVNIDFAASPQAAQPGMGAGEQEKGSAMGQMVGHVGSVAAKTGEAAARGIAMTPLLTADFAMDVADVSFRAVGELIRPVFGDELADMAANPQYVDYIKGKIDESLPIVRGDEEGVGYTLVREVVPYLLTGARTAASMAGTILGKSTFATGLAAGAVSDFTMVQPEEGNLASMFRDLGVLPEWLEFLSADQYDEAMVGRLVSTVEGAGVGTVLEKGFKGAKQGIVSLAKRSREVHRASMRKVEYQALEQLYTPSMQLPENGSKYAKALISLTKARIGRGQSQLAFVVDMVKRGFDRDDAMRMYETVWNSMYRPSPHLGKQAGMVAFHGTPHKFDKFTLEHIGTGEGAQAYGWGLYFAGDQQIAKYYKETLATDPADALGEMVMTLVRRGDTSFPAVKKLMQEYDVSFAGKADDRHVVELVQRAAVGENPDGTVTDDALRAYQQLEKIFPKEKGYIKKVDIPEDEDLLDYDAPLSEQPEKVRNALEKIGSRVGGSEDFGSFMKRAERNPMFAGDIIGKDQATMKEVSEALLEAGIPGLRYWDGNSRNKPIKQLKRQFLKELPEDADFDEVEELLGTGHFTPEIERIIEIIRDSDWLGFDKPAQALSAALTEGKGAYDFPDEVHQIVKSLREGGHRNYVIWDEEAIEVLEDLE